MEHCKSKSTSRSFDRRKQCMQEHDVSAILIDKIDGSNPIKTETNWMQSLKTIAPYGRNVKNGV